MDMQGDEHYSSDSYSNDEYDSLVDLIVSEDEDESICEVLSIEQILKEMESFIGEVAAVINMEPTIVGILLNHFKWNKETLYETYFSGGQEKLFREAHVVNPHRSSNTRNMQTCLICYSEDMGSESLACGHRFCVDCWKEYLKTKIMDEGIGMSITCAAYDCNVFVDDKTVMKLINDSKIINRYHFLISKNFVHSNQLLRWCPRPDCDNVLKVQLAIMQPVTCTCRYKCCFFCSEIWHRPVDCKLLNKWRMEYSDEAESVTWLIKNTKECPKCGASIEKNGGCNHITCAAPGCQAHFCWLCLCLLKNHDDGKCETYVEDSSVNSTRARKYVFYCERYKKHIRSLKFQDKLYSSAEHFSEASMLVSRSSCYLNAVDILCECRRTLMHTYVFAFYVKRNNQLDIFLENQKDLETATESLAGYLERDLGDISLEHLKNIQDKSIYCRRRCKVLLNHVEEGYDMDWWEFT